MPGLLGKKIGMTSVFSADGKNVPCTVIEVGPCVVTQIKTLEKDVDSLRFDTLARSTVVLHVPQPQGNVHLATKLFNLSVHRKAAHQRQVAVGLLAAFLHVK